MRELAMDEIQIVDGGVVSDDAVYGASVGLSAAFLVTAIAAAPILAAGGVALLAGASIAASANAIYTVLK